MNSSVGMADASAYEAYLADAQEQIQMRKQACMKWKFDDNLDQSVLNLNENQPMEEDSVNDEKVELFYGGGLFFTMIFKKLENILNQPLESNLMLTGIFTTLAHYPFPLIYEYLLNSNLNLRPGINSLWSILNKLSVSVHERRIQMGVGPFNDALTQAREEIAGNSVQRQKNDIEKRRFFSRSYCTRRVL